MKFDPLYNPYPSKRTTVYGKSGMVATSQHLAASAGLDILKRGGNAIDAAIAAASCLTVTEPTSNGIGGDLFAIVWHNKKLYGMNSSGPAPMLLNMKTLKDKGYSQMPIYGWYPVTVPGITKGWADLSERFGKLSLSECLKSAIGYARDGYPVSPTVSVMWDNAYKLYKSTLKDEMYKEWFKVFAPKGRAPKPGEIWSSNDMADTLQLIGETNARSFYEGDLAEKIDAFSRKYDGFLRKGDLESYKASWVEPISVYYKGYDVWEIPPNGHGIVALMALNIAKGLDFSQKMSIDTIHKQIESIKLSYADGMKYISDPKYMNVGIEDLLSDRYADLRRAHITDTALDPFPGTPPLSGTVYLATADGQGNMVSLIQSNYKGFGSGLVVPNSGISLHNRGYNFVFEEGHPNCPGPGKKPYHTIIPGFLTKDGEAIGPFGVMGGFMQPQGHMQVIMNTIDFNLNPQQALDAPRWRWVEGKQVEVEPSIPAEIVEGLKLRGHQVSVQPDLFGFGRGQMIWKTEGGVLAGGTECRTDGAVLAI